MKIELNKEESDELKDKILFGYIRTKKDYSDLSHKAEQTNDILKSTFQGLNKLCEDKPNLRNFLYHFKQHPSIKSRIGLFGGAARDFLLGKEFKDLDFVFESSEDPKEDERILTEVFKLCGINPNFKERTSLGGYLIYLDRVRLDIWNMKNTISFIEKQMECSWENILQSVSLNSDQIIVRLDGVVYEDGFFDLLDNKVLKLVSTKWSNNKSIAERALRFADKYKWKMNKRLLTLVKEYGCSKCAKNMSKCNCWECQQEYNSSNDVCGCNDCKEFSLKCDCNDPLKIDYYEKYEYRNYKSSNVKVKKSSN